jgi:hypothetical protein
VNVHNFIADRQCAPVDGAVDVTTVDVLEEQEQAVGRVNGLSTTEEQQPVAIDAFLESISKTVPQPLLTPRPQHTFPSQPASPPPSINKRQSTRLAKKSHNQLWKRGDRDCTRTVS